MYDVVQVESKSDLQDFIQLPFTLYRGDPNFVPPLRSRVKSALEADNSCLLEARTRCSSAVRTSSPWPGL